MKHNIHNYSIKTKLIFFLSLSAFLALFISTSSTLVYYYFDDKNRVVEDHIKLAEVSGKNIAASLLFLDKDSTANILNPIFNDKNVKYIQVYDAKGASFISLGSHQGKKNHWTKSDFLNYKNVKTLSTWNNIHLLTSITHAHEHIGFLETIISTNGIKERMIEQTVVSSLIILITIFIIMFLAFWLEEIFTKPIFDLLNAVRKVKASNDFNVQLAPYTKDEFSELFTEFNTMVNALSQRDKILKEHNLDLKVQVDTKEEQLKTTQNDLQTASKLATIDVLTNLYNRRYMMEKFDILIRDAQQTQKALGVILLDIDHFKLVNDSLGHQVGDIVLKEVAKTLQENARASDVAGRIGGEEFLILCKESDTQTTYDVAERLRKKVEDLLVSYEEEKTIQVKISIGISSSIPSVAKEALLKITDQALYSAKETGRNKVCIGGIS